MTDTPKHIAILGGGMSALSTAYQLTQAKDWKQHYDITVYQMGWRLGGKVASGSNNHIGADGIDYHGRFEDTGVHFLMGFYDNMFQMVHEGFNELHGITDPNDKTWLSHFNPQDYSYETDEMPDGTYHIWENYTAPNTRVPGNVPVAPTLMDYIIQNLHNLLQREFANLDKITLTLNVDDIPDQAAKTILDGARNVLQRAFDTQPGSVIHQVTTEVKTHHSPLLNGLIEHFADVLPSRNNKRSSKVEPNVKAHTNNDIETDIVLALLRFLIGPMRIMVDIVWDLAKDEIMKDASVREAFFEVDLAVAIAAGIFKYDILEKGFHVINDVELTQWIIDNGAHKESACCALLTGFYDSIFAYKDGIRGCDTRFIAAGVGLYALYREFLTYRGSTIYTMVNSTGVAVFSPLYKVLAARGVKFEFFSRVRSLVVSDDSQSIKSIAIGKQVHLKDTTVPYQPLIPLEGSPDLVAWPTTPNYDQIVDSEAEYLKVHSVNLEQYASDTQWKDVDTVTLQAGTDFDIVVLGIPIGALPCVVANFAEINSQWATTFAESQTVKTRAFEMWMLPSLKDAGWAYQPPILGAYMDPFAAYGELNSLRTSYELSNGVNTLLHWAVPIPEPVKGDQCEPLTPDDHIKANEAVKAEAIAWLQKSARWIWPLVAQKDNPDALDWANLFTYGAAADGVDRFNYQYWAANIDPSILYDLSAPLTIEHRPKTDQSGFSNLYLTGTWMNTGLNFSILEAGTVAGMLAANAISKVVTGTASPDIATISGLFLNDYTYPDDDYYHG